MFDWSQDDHDEDDGDGDTDTGWPDLTEPEEDSGEVDDSDDTTDGDTIGAEKSRLDNNFTEYFPPN